jgi:NAD(P)-dependent dehydrogenase (short-subunit alcohol dehydrogenase family)
MAAMQRLVGKVALITGGSSGIGLATAKLFVAEGARVIISGRREKELVAAVSELDGAATGIQGDVSQMRDLDRLFAQLKRAQVRLDIVFANAGVGEFVPLGAITEEHFDRTFDVNVKGTLFMVQKALELMPDGGSIILNASIASTKGFPAFFSH